MRTSMRLFFASSLGVYKKGRKLFVLIKQKKYNRESWVLYRIFIIMTAKIKQMIIGMINLQNFIFLNDLDKYFSK